MTQEKALQILKSGANVFLTGEPGSGKTYVVNEYVAYLHSHSINPAITASTGIAATHIGGMTIHSWSGVGIKNKLSHGDLHSIATSDYVKKRVSKAKVLIIDEISMLPPESLQMVDSICREIKDIPKPFGGMQVVLVGDFFQLPPVVKSYVNTESQETLFDEAPARFAYDHQIWEQTEFVTCYLTEQYRQDDSALISLLSKIRCNSFDAESLKLIKQRKSSALSLPADVPRLYTHNVDVDRVNQQMLAKIPGDSQLFPMRTKGHPALVKSMKKGCLSPESLYLKPKAVVMFTKNNPKEGYVNGTLGEVLGFDIESDLPVVRTKNGREIEVGYADWSLEEDGKIKGLLSQLPLRLAWAITVHKSQGVSLDEAVVDLSQVFEFGQGYVALSRVRSLAGIHILGWNDLAFQVDRDVLQKDHEFRHDSDSAEKIFARFSDAELKKMYEEFIIHCGGDIKISDYVPGRKSQKPSTQDETLKLWQKGKDLCQIAEMRNLTATTILGHLEELVKNGKIKKDEVKRIIPPELLNSAPQIQAAFKKPNTDKLTPVFKYFKGKYSYYELKLVRLAME